MANFALRTPRRTGFTLVEIAVTISILVVIGTLALVSFIGSRNTRDLATAGQEIVSVLRKAQARALAGENNMTWGVHFDTTRAVLFRGPTYAGSTLTETHLLPSSVTFYSVNLAGGGSDVIFSKITGSTEQPGSVELRITGSGQTGFSITIDASGKIYQTASAGAQTGSRITDLRHRNFQLGWSIRNADTMTLVFSDPPNPDTVYPVGMAPYFNADQTEFDWSGGTTVGSVGQTLRIHTTLLSSNNTILSVDRDCRTNTKKMQLLIDGADIATWEADCATIAVGPSGGTMMEP